MKPNDTTVATFLVSLLFALVCLPVAAAAANSEGDGLFDNGDTESLIAGGYEMVYSKDTGDMLEWVDSDGEYLLFNQGE